VCNEATAAFFSGFVQKRVDAGGVDQNNRALFAEGIGGRLC
jgi:hypothetical protein